MGAPAANLAVSTAAGRVSGVMGRRAPPPLRGVEGKGPVVMCGSSSIHERSSLRRPHRGGKGKSGLSLFLLLLLLIESPLFLLLLLLLLSLLLFLFLRVGKNYQGVLNGQEQLDVCAQG